MLQCGVLPSLFLRGRLSDFKSLVPELAKKGPAPQQHWQFVSSLNVASPITMKMKEIRETSIIYSIIYIFFYLGCSFSLFKLKFPYFRQVMIRRWTSWRRWRRRTPRGCSGSRRLRRTGASTPEHPLSAAPAPASHYSHSPYILSLSPVAVLDVFCCWK